MGACRSLGAAGAALVRAASTAMRRVGMEHSSAPRPGMPRATAQRRHASARTWRGWRRPSARDGSRSIYYQVPIVSLLSLRPPSRRAAAAAVADGRTSAIFVHVTSWYILMPSESGHDSSTWSAVLGQPCSVPERRIGFVLCACTLSPQDLSGGVLVDLTLFGLISERTWFCPSHGCARLQPVRLLSLAHMPGAHNRGSLQASQQAPKYTADAAAGAGSTLSPAQEVRRRLHIPAHHERTIPAQPRGSLAHSSLNPTLIFSRRLSPKLLAAAAYSS